MRHYLPSNLLPCIGFALLLALVLLAHPCQATAAPSKDKSVTKTYSLAQARCNTLEFSPTLAKNRENWLLCAQGFQRGYQLDPYHPSAPNTLFNQGALYVQMYKKFNHRDDLNEALSLYDDVVTLFPQQSLADDALYQAATLHDKELKDPKSAALLLAKLVAVYPKGDMYDQAAADLTRVKSALFAPTSAPSASDASQVAEKKASTLAPPTATSSETRKLRQTEVVNVRHWSTKNYTRVVIETSAPVAYEDHLLKKDAGNSKRLYVDLQGCLISRDLQQAVPVKDGLLQRMRSAQFAPETVRVVLDTMVISDYKIFSLDDPFRIIIDLKGIAGAAPPPPLPLPPVNQAPPPFIAQGSAPPPTLAQQLGLGIKRVVLDPGHGGKDPGAIGLNGLREKDIVLNVAKKVARKISSQMGIEVVLTRKTDIFIPLEERTAIANTKNGDLFISIHANAAKSSSAQGIETYYLDLATNEADRGLAALENSSSTRQISDLQDILRSLMQNSKKDESARLAGTVQSQLVSGLSRSYCDINNHGVKTAPFIVLIGAQMPSILTEIAFISNPLENQRLQDEKYLEDLADHITAGVATYSSSLTMARL